MCVGCLLVVFLSAFVSVVFSALNLAILVQVLRSWIPTLRLPFELDRFLADVTEPVLGPLRRALPTAGGIDFSPFIALLVLRFVESLIRSLIPPVV